MHFLPTEPFVIISANTEIQDWRDAVTKSTELRSELRAMGFKFKAVSGCFKGKIEVSYYIPWLDESDALLIAKKFNQESVLVVDERRLAHLAFTDGSESKALGRFIEGESDDNYTIDGGVKYICTGVDNGCN